MTQIVVVQPGQSRITPSGPQYGVKYALVGPDGARAVFNDPGDPDYVGMLTNVSGLDSPDVRESADDLIGDDGGVHGDFFYGRRPLVLEGLIDNRPSPYLNVDSVSFAARNEVTNPSIEINATGYATTTSANAGDGSLTSGRISEGSTIPFGGSYAYQASKTLGAVANGYVSVYNTGKYELPDHVQRVWFHVGYRMAARPSNNMVTTLVARCYNSSGTYISSPVVATRSGPPASSTIWLTLSGELAVNSLPAGTAMVSLEVVCQQTTGTAGTLDFRADAFAVVFDHDTRSMAYFDGASRPNEYTWRTSWDGAPHLSASVLSYVDQVPMEANQVRNTRMTRLQRATNAMRNDATMRWQVEGGVEQTVKVRRQQPLRLSGGFNKSFQAALVAADPRLYAATVKEARTDPTTFVTTVTNDGTTGTPPVITIYGPTSGSMTAFSLHNQSNGGSIVFAPAFGLASGQYIVVDFANRTVTRDNGSNLFGQIQFASTNWWDVSPGENSIQLIGTGRTGASALIRWQDAWI